MEDNYDFSHAERGKFFRAGAQLAPPVRLGPEVLDCLTRRAKAEGVSLDELVNRLLKRNI